MLEVKKGFDWNIKSFEKKDDCVILYMEKGMLRVVPVTDKIIRVSMTLKDEFSDDPGVGIVYDPSGSTPEFDVEELITQIKIITDKVVVRVRRNTGSVAVYDINDKPLFVEESQNSKLLEPFTSYNTIIDDKTVTRKVTTPDGVKTVIDYATKEEDKELYHTTLYFSLLPDESLYGLGQHDDGNLNLRGTIQYLHQANLKIAIPMLLSTQGYGLLVPTGSPAIFSDLGYEDTYFYTEADKELNYYVICGPSFDEIISGYRLLTGKASMLPKWMFGYVQSQERYEDQDDIINAAEEMRKRGIGCDVMVQDWFYWEDGHWGQKTFEAERYPDPQKMIDRIHELDLKYMISIWPIMNEQTQNYKEFKDRGLLFPASEIYDAFKDEARELYWKQANEGLYKYGVDAWWCDNSEPFTPEWARNPKPIPQKMYEEYVAQTSQAMPDELANAYGLYHAKGISDGQRKTSPDKRVANLTRNAYTGAQKYGVILWSGDICASWVTFGKQIAAGLSFCASGLPYWTLDIGAFFVKNGDFWYWSGKYDKGLDDLGYRELYVRWYQFGAFLPIFRAHGTDVRREPWHFGEPGDMFYDALIYANQLRYKLIPYIYSYAYEVYKNDKTMIRPLVFDFPDDIKTRNIQTQYMFGDSIMVCPVTYSMYYSINSRRRAFLDEDLVRKVYLPDGCAWYDFYTNEKYEGGQLIEADAPLDKIPLFVKEGSIIPMSAEAVTNVSQIKDVGVKVFVYPGCDCTYEFYDDSGDGFEYETGDVSSVILKWYENERKLHIPDDAKQKMKKMNSIIKSWQVIE